MNERRVSLGNRALSLLLALVMVIGMLPLSVLSVFAADTTTDASTTAQSIGKIQAYAKKMVTDNIDAVKTTSTNDVSWDTAETKSYTWLYYNGLMLDALLSGGFSGTTASNLDVDALELASRFYDANIKEDSSGNAYIVRFGTDNADGKLLKGELDSIAPARAMFDLLGTAKDQDKYHDIIQTIYSALMDSSQFGLVENTGGNYKHKQTDSWNIVAMDGIYMAQPFFMECAEAIRAGNLTLKDSSGNTISADTIEAAVYARMDWIGNNMKFTATDGTGAVLYHHGFNPNTSDTGNGVVWGRGAGWYAAALVDVIEMTNDPARKSALVKHLKTFLDGMLKYQDVDGNSAINSSGNTGMWYNVVYPAYSNSGNQLETSGTALMAYALLKAHNMGYTQGSAGISYKDRGLAAFNGIVANKYDGTNVNGIYPTASVFTDKSKYCGSDYASNEGKGVGPLIMAAVQADIANSSAAETFKIGAVSAPDMVIALNTTPDYSDVKITVVGSQGTVKNVPVTDSNVTIEAVMAAAVGDTAGNATATVYYSGDPIGTFNIAVVDTESGETVNGTISVPTGGTATVPSAPSFSSGNFVKVKSGTSGTGFVLTTTLQPGVPYVFTKGINSSTVNGAGYSSGKIAGLSVKGTSSKEVVDGVYTLSAASGSLVYWYVDSENRIYTVDGNTNYYLRLTGTSSGNIELTTTASDASKFTFTVSSGKIQFTDSTHNRNAYINSGGFTNASAGSSNAVYAFEPQSTSDTYAQLTGSEGLVYALGTSGDTISSAIKASTAFSVLVADNADGTDAEPVAMSNSLVTVEAPSTYDANTAGTYSFIVKYDGVQIGTIPVTTYDNSGSTTTYNVSLTVTPMNMVLDVNGTDSFFAKVAVANGGTTLSGWSFSDMTVDGYSSVVTVDGNQVTGASAGSTTITVTLNSVTDGTNTYTLSSPISKTIDVTVNEPHSHSYTSAVTTAATCTTAGTRTYTCSCGDSYTEEIDALGHSYSNGTCTVCGAADPDYSETHNYAVTITTPSGGDILLGGTTATLGATLTDNQTTVDGAAYSWSITSGSEYGSINADTGALTLSNVEGTVIVKVSASVDGKEVVTAEKPITISPVDATITGSDTAAVGSAETYTASPVDGYTTVTWTVENGTGAATLNAATGGSVTLTGTTAGTVTLTATITNLYNTGGTYTATKTVTVEAATVEEGNVTVTTGGTTWYNGTLTLDPTSVSMTVGDDDVNIADTVAATAVEGGATATINNFTTDWESSDTNVATVDNNGNVHAVGAGTATITAKLATVTINGATGTIHEDITATATVTVTASSGTDTPSTVYSHNFTTDGDTDPEGQFTFSGEILDNTSVSGYDRAMKINSDALVTFTAPADGVLNLVFSGDTQIKVNGTLYERSGNTVSIPVSAGEVTIERDNSTTYLYELSYATGSAVTYSLSDLVFNPSSIVAGQSTQVTTAVTASDGSSHTYTLQWMVEETAMSDTGLSTAFNAMSAGEYTVTAKLTHVDGTELATPVTKTGTITVGNAVATSGSLNNASVTVTQGTDINLSALSASLTFSDGSNATVNLAQSGFTFKKDGSNISITDVDATVGTHTIAVYYDGVSIGNLTVTVNAKVESTSAVSYVLDTDGVIEDDSDYLIVAYVDGTYYALTCNKSTTAGSTVVVPENGVINLESDVAAKLLWHFANQNSDFTSDNGVTYDCFQISNNGYYLQSGGANYSNSATSVYAAKIGESDGTYEIALKFESDLPRALYCEGTSWARNDKSETRERILYLYKKVEAQSVVTLGDLPMLYIGGTPFQAKLSDYVTSVTYSGTAYTDYEIQWTSGNSAVAYIDGQYVNGTGAGTAQLVAKLISVGGTDVSSENIVATTTVYVTAPSLDLGEDVTKLVGESFTADRQVLIGSIAVENYELKWTSSNESVATVDQDGKVSVVGTGTATIYAQIISTNTNNISEFFTITDSFTVNAEVIAITSGELSSDTVTVEVGATTEALQSALSGITLTLTKNNGETVVIDNATLFEDVDLTAVNTAAGGTYYLDVSYSDPNSDYTFSGTVTVKVFNNSMIQAEGFLTQEQDVQYILDTDGIDPNEEYVFVMQNSDGEWVAMMNPDADGSGSTKGSSQVVTRSDDTLTITVSQNADLVEWLFTNEGSSSSNGFSYKTFTVKNNNRYLKGGGDSILGSSSKNVGVWYAGDGSGAYYIGTDYSSGKVRALTLSGDSWTRASSSAYPNDSTARVYMYKRSSVGYDFSVGFEVQPDSKTLAEGTSYTVPGSDIAVVIAGDVNCTNYVIEWSSSDTDVATVDSNGKITAVGEGTATITATLMTADGYKVYSNADNTQGISDEIAVTVQADQLTYKLQGSPLTVPLGGEPDFSKVSLLIDSTLGDDIVVPSDQLVFKYIDAVAGGFDTDDPIATCTVDVYYNGKLLEQKLVLKVADNAYDGLDQATSYPEYPDPGAVRMNKFATGINFNTTGVAKIELNAAGISSRKPVDVVLIVDVSNSMNWSMDWFEGLTDDAVKAADDAAKTDSSKDDKLDLAMTAAQSFAAILMENNVAGSDANNTMTFVTFGGNDLDRGGPTKSVDTVVTAFVGEDVLANVNNSFANTMFTGSQTLKISGTDGNAIVSGDARGNTIYDAAFVEAMAAVEQLKIAKAGSVADYDASGREVHIIFMTDGAPSHYNDKCYDNSNTHGTWFTKFSPSDSNTPDDTEWLNFIKNPNDDATELYDMVTGFHIVGYDLAHGGFGSHNWTEAELGRVLGGLVENKALDYTLATDTEKLNAFFDDLGHSLAYAGTHALVTDIVSEEFILQTDPIDLYGDKSEMLAPTIEIVERQLVVRTDIGKTMSINGVNTVVTEAHLGMYVDGGEKILATVTFDTTDATDKKAFSTALDDSEDIWDDTTNIITGKYFTYSFSNKTFEWKIGNIEDTEIALNYYGYLTGAKNAEGEGGRAEGIYATNEEATLKYINTDNQIVIREYPVPRVAWGKASATVRFFLVNDKGEYTNLAGNTFNNPANRVFLVNSATYQFDLNTNPNSLLPGVITAQDAFTKAAVSNQYALYDDVTMNITNSTMQNVTGSAGITAGVDKSNTEALVEFIDVNGDGSYIQAVINVPVVATGRLGTNQPLTGETVVLDYAKPIDVQLFNHNELLITNYGYKMELYGLAAYDPAFDTKLYLLESEYSGKELAVNTEFNAGFGKFKIIDKAKGIIEFHPTSIAHGPVQVFAIAKITQLSNENNVYYLYNPLTIVPATTVYYETDFADGVFTTAATKGSWTTATEGNTGATLQDADPDVNRRDDELNGVPHVKDAYGSDSSYAGDNKLSGGSSLKAAGQGVNDTTVSFTFTGTGFDIISRTGAAQGMIRVTVLDSNGANVKTVRVTNQGTNELYQIPVVSVEGLEHGTYTVTIGVYTATNYTGDFAYLNRGNEFHFDAVRIYGTADGNKVAETEYKLDGEFAPNIQEVRDLLITKDQFTAASGKTGAVWLDPYGNNTDTNTNVVGTYKTQGPNNEVYLAYGQGIAFQIESSTVPATVQIGAKSISGNSVTLNAYIGDANSTATATLTQTIATSTDMYYELTADYEALFADGVTYVVVWNTGSNVLSVTDIKVAYTTDPAETVVVTYSEEMATFASNLLVTAVEQDDPDMTVAKGEDGKYYYYVADRVNEAYTGLVELDNGTWYVQDGQIVFNFDGAITFQGETYYIKAGRVSEATNGLYKYTGEWMYYTSGKVDTAYTGLAERSGMIVYVANGAVDFTKTGAVSHDGKLYYVRYGVVDSSFTGLVRADNGAWVYVTAGQQDTAYTGIVAHGGNNWYVENGTVNFQFTGTVADANGNWTVNRGQATAANN